MANHLKNETSPYLLQHADNPVDWYPWGDEAFEKARQENKPIFLSIGYSTCHWCHVMAHECFEDKEVADLLNEHFVSIKVDREERPDIDEAYMAFCQATTGSGGWPLSVFLTSEAHPFFAGTYFPKHRKGPLPGFVDVLKTIIELWQTKGEEVRLKAQTIVQILNERAVKDADASPEPQTLWQEAYTQLGRIFDRQWGGFGPPPKFPNTHYLHFLMRVFHNTNEHEALQMATRTLKAIIYGGIHDQIGGGFHRYSVDRTWLIPHFEKMLYDQALISLVLTEAFQLTGDPEFAEAISDCCSYVLRDMRCPKSGAFYSAEDADSEGQEGLFYLWTKDEIIKVLGKEDGEKGCIIFGVTDRGNFEGKNILTQAIKRAELFENKRFDNELRQLAYNKPLIKDLKTKLFNARTKRTRPFQDDKIISGWNGLEVAALARAGVVLNIDSFIEAAEKASVFIEKSMMDASGNLKRIYRKDSTKYAAFLEDYVYVILGFMELYQITGATRLIDATGRLIKALIANFWNEQEKVFNNRPTSVTDLPINYQSLHDSALPAATSILYDILTRWYILSGNQTLKDKLRNLEKRLLFEASEFPLAMTSFISSFDRMFIPGKEFFIVEGSDRLASEIRKTLSREFNPRQTIITISSDEKEKDLLAKWIPYVDSMNLIDEKTTVYLCKEGKCQSPVKGAIFLASREENYAKQREID